MDTPTPVPSAPHAAIDTHLAGFPPDIAARLAQVRAAIRAEAPDAVETIAYGIPTFDLLGKHLVHFAGYMGHVGFYPTGSGMAAFAARLTGYPTSKGAVQFPHAGPLPLDLVAEIVRFRVGEVRQAAAGAKPKRPRRPPA